MKSNSSIDNLLKLLKNKNLNDIISGEVWRGVLKPQNESKSANGSKDVRT